MLLSAQKSRFNPELRPYAIGEDSALAQKKFQFNIRAEKEANLILDSDDRNQSAYPSPNKFILPIPTNIQNIYRLKLHDFYGWYDIPNIVAGKNNRIIVSGTPVDLTEGFYATPSAMASHIQARLQAVVPSAGTWSVSYSATTQNLIISHSVITNYTVVGTDRTQLTYGVREGSNVAVGSTYTGKIPTLYYSRYFDVLSNELTKYSRSDSTTSGHASGILFRYYFPPITPDNISFQDFNPKQIEYQSIAPIPNVDIAIYDEWGELLYVPSYSNFSMGIVLQVVANPV